MPRWGPCQCGHMGPPLMVMGTMVMVVENHFPAAFRHQLDVFIFRASVTAHSIKPICDQHKMQVGQCCIRARHLAINSYHLFWAKSFITNPLPHNSSAAEPQNTSTPHTHTFHTLIYVFIYWSHSHHWALHDAFEEDEVQVIGSCGTCAVTQCVQGLMHGYTNIKKRKKRENTQKKKTEFISLYYCATFHCYPWETDWTAHLKDKGSTYTVAHTSFASERSLEGKWAEGRRGGGKGGAASHPFPSNFTSVSHSALKSVTSGSIFLPQLPTSSFPLTYT